MTTGEELQKRLGTMTIIWSSLLAGIGMYVGVVYLLATETPDFPYGSLDEEMAGMVELALGVFGGGMAAVSYMTGPLLLNRTMALRAVKKAGLDPFDADRERLGMAIYPTFFTGYMVRWAFAEGVALVGMVASLLVGLHAVEYALFALSAVTMAGLRPAPERLDALVAEVRRG
jgi:hypothetical protein